MFSLKDYVGAHWNSPDWDEERMDNAYALISACSKLQAIMEKDGIVFQMNPKTGTSISGDIYGGFRPQDCPIGAPKSAHKEAMAVDRHDPDEKIDEWLINHQEALVQCGIYIELPERTIGWSHWQIRPTKNRIFMP
jgi:hypothetical protein